MVSEKVSREEDSCGVQGLFLSRVKQKISGPKVPIL